MTPNPFVTWMILGVRTWETLWASGQVITHRTSRALLSDPRYSERDRRELTLMGREKLEAGAESYVAMGASLPLINTRYAALAFTQWMAMAKTMLSLANSRSIGQSIGQQAKLAQVRMMGTTERTAKIADSVARVASRGLKPIHARATKNAKRLRQK